MIRYSMTYIHILTNRVHVNGETAGLCYFPRSTLICNLGQVDGKGAASRSGAGHCSERISTTLYYLIVLPLL